MNILATTADYRELANFDFAESPVNEQQIRMLHDGDSIQRQI